MDCYISFHDTQGTIFSYKICGGQKIYCNGNCFHCSRATVIYSTMNQTSNAAGIHIIKKP